MLVNPRAHAETITVPSNHGCVAKDERPFVPDAAAEGGYFGGHTGSPLKDDPPSMVRYPSSNGLSTLIGPRFHP
jgi:hypothetical protein